MTLLTDKKLVKKEPKYGIQIRCAVQRHWAAVPVLDVKRDAPKLAILKAFSLLRDNTVTIRESI